MADRDVLEAIEKNVSACDTGKISELLPAVKDEAAADDILKSLNKGIEAARKLFKEGTYALPDFLLAIDAYRLGTHYLRNNIKEIDDSDNPRVVIGVVEGDVHDMGKNIVAAVLEASGFSVTDLGNNVSNDNFLEALKSVEPEILALSTMMSTTLENMEALIRQVKSFFPKTLILIGGAPFDPDLARDMGADGYAENVITIPDESQRILLAARPESS